MTGPLKNIRVLDLGRYQAGPRCGLMFARMGAEVIKVESLHGDESRKNSPHVRGQSIYWVQYNSGKKSLSIDLRTDEGKDVIRDLVKVSDFFLQNFRPGTIEKMGFSYEELKRINNRIVMINVSAYGPETNFKNRVGFDPIGQAMGGMMMTSGIKGGPPVRTHFPLIDRITALHATIGALAALHERERSGIGQSINVSLADSGFTTNEIPISAYLSGGLDFEREGNGSGLTNAYQCVDGWVFLAATNRSMFERLSEALNNTHWPDDPKYKTRQMRKENAHFLEESLTKWFISRTQTDAVSHLSKYNVPCAKINDTKSAADEDYIIDSEIMEEVPDPIAGNVWVTGKSIKFSRTPMKVQGAPNIGEHTELILNDILKYSPEKIQVLKDSQIIR
ncbi:MAG: hypothetical protein CL904_06885 [Dehalococcoidia bacterium]|nr:hypothetical protein [Dehalococcoidia bacterium]MQG16148.1 CoA transferase [SAR202 cluster bacterium]|tara:strand:+ start:31333 stop:32508 length:1176 start_codon:yes stop_codon:yes gene_type:complete